MSYTNILIPIETSSRELIYKVYLCHSLALKGFRCYLGRKSHINFLIKNLKGFIYLDKGYHKNQSEKIYETVKNNDGIIVSLDEEGGVDFADGSTLMGRYSKTLFKNSDLTFLWGEQQDKLLKNNIYKENKVVITGHPRFELLKQKFHFLYQEEVDKIKKRFQDFILINTNMGFGNNIRGDDFVKSNYGIRFKNIDQIIAFDKKKLEAYKSLIMELFYHLEKKIILRPHPEENHSFYFDAFKDRKNIHVIYEGSVIPWILAAEIMIHPDCTTAIETLFAGKKPISYLPDDYPTDLVTHLPLTASECFTNEIKLISFIKNSMNSLGNIDLGNYPFAENYFSISKPTTKLIVDGLFQLKHGSNYRSEKKLPLSIRMKFFLKQVKSKFQADNPDKLIQKKLSGFTSKNTLFLSDILKKNMHEFRNISINQINEHLHQFFANK